MFTGRIIVRPGAQRTDSKQSNNNMLLTENARADSQPQLEIYADDVRCTHGATLGPIDAQERDWETTLVGAEFNWDINEQLALTYIPSYLDFEWRQG